MPEPPGFRAAAMDWLDRRPSARVDYSFLAGFEYEGERVPLIEMQRGIRKPKKFEAALAITTTYTPSYKTPPYADAIGSDGLQRYKYQGSNPNSYDNVLKRPRFSAASIRGAALG